MNKKIFTLAVILTLLIVRSNFAFGAINFTVTNSSSSGTLSGGMTFHCFNNGPTGLIQTSVNLKSPSCSGCTNNSVKVFLLFDGFKTGEYFDFTIPNDGNFHNQNIPFEFGDLIFEGGQLTFEAQWKSGQLETATAVFLFIKGVQLDIEGSRRPGKIILAGCNSMNTVRIKGKGWVCPGTTFQYDLEVQEVNIYTGANVGSLYSLTVTGGNLTSMESGTLSLTSLISGTITITNQSRYRVKLTCSASRLNISKTNYFVWKAGEFDLTSKDYYAYKPLGAGNHLNWFKDDLGEEENRTKENIYNSADICNKYTSSTSWIPSTLLSLDNPGVTGEHKNPDYVTNSSNKNYLFVKVNNIGCGVPNPLFEPQYKVRMFWTRARLGEIWDDQWLFTSTNIVVDGNNLDRPAGSEITILNPTFANPYNNNPAPIYASTFPASNMAIMSTFVKGWYPPNPVWYTPKNGSMSNGTPVICLLSKINEFTSSVALSAQTNDPVVWLQSSCDIDPFTRQNNNIATKNTLLMDLPFNLPPGQSNLETNFGTVIANNPTSNATRICIRNITNRYLNDGNILDYGDLQIGFTNLIWNNWVANGSQGSGFNIISSTLVSVTNPDSVCFDSIFVGNDMSEQIGIRMVWDTTAIFPTDTPLFEYAIQQENSAGFAAYRGSDVIIQFPITAYVDTTGSEMRSGGGSSQEKKEQQKSEKRSSLIKDDQRKNITYQVYPNPANNYVIVSIIGVEENDLIQAEILDITGRSVNAYSDFIGSGNGIKFANINTSNLAKGIYTVKLNVNGTIIVEKLVIQ